MASGVIFDMDGVLVLTENAHWLAWKAAADRRGVAIDYPTFLSCFGRVNPDCIRIMFGDATPDAESARIADEKEHAFREIIKSDVPLAPGLIPLLDSLRAAHVPLAVGSSAPPENVDLVLDAGRIRPYFSAVVDGTQVARGKPAPDVFLRAGKLLGLAPADCAVIEDAPAGILAAKAAGMLAIGVATTHKDHELLAAGADIVFPALADLSAPLLLNTDRAR
jgi:beta-phosphoglucomutase family hydrolase